MIETIQLENGLSIVVEEMPHVESAAYDLFLPGGMIAEEPHCLGCSLILAELTSRGTKSMSSRQISEAFDGLGVRNGQSAGQDRFVYSGVLVADKLEATLELLADIVCHPSLPEDEIESIRSVLLQDLASLQDNPARRSFIELASRYYPQPYNRSSYGTEEGLKNTTLEDLRRSWERFFRPKRTVLSVAGNVQAQDVKRVAERVFKHWQGEAPQAPAFGSMPAHALHHIEQESAQLQIALNFPSVPFGHKYYYVAKVITGMLSGGMHGRLFVEVREKRGLCYSVFAQHSSTRHYGTMTAYAGTTPERAHETLEVLLKELRGLSSNVTDEELLRSKANLKASLVMGEESSGSRAASNASDWWLLGKIRSLDEIKAAIDAVSHVDVQQYWKDFPLRSFMLVTLGSEKWKQHVDVEKLFNA